jgi:hypothetical protein
MQFEQAIVVDASRRLDRHRPPPVQILPAGNSTVIVVVLINLTT